jgi:hypothetical protein
VLSAAERQSGQVKKHVKPAVAGSHLLIAPVLLPEQSVWITVQTPSGRALNNVSVWVNNELVNTDLFGQVQFTLPKANNFSFSLRDKEGKVVDKRDYALSSDGYLLPTGQNHDFYLKFLRYGATAKSDQVQIFYAPIMLEAGERILILGKGFSGRPGEDRLLIDGLDARVLSSSPVSMIAMVPYRLSLGPLRDIVVKNGELSSAPREVDICSVELISRDKIFEPAKTYKARIHALGTNLPALVEVDNLESSNMSMTLMENGQVLPKTFRLATPGGERNYLEVVLNFKNKSELNCRTHLVSEGNLLACVLDPNTDSLMLKLCRQAVAGDIMRLQRRSISADGRIRDLKQRLNIAAKHDATGEQVEKLKRQIDALSQRQAGIQSMLYTRKLVLQLFGGSESDFQSAVTKSTSPQ